ncbi:MAG: flagellar basal body-associated protein FliL [Nitriliruptoraceae bacterium]
MSTTETVDLVDEEEEQPRRKVLLLVVGLVLLLCAAGGAWWFLGDHEPAEPADGEVLVVPPMTTTTGNASLRHARISMGIVLVEGVVPDELTPKLPLLQDALLQAVAEMDSEQLRSLDGSDALREQLSREAIDIWGEEVVRRVVLTELLVQ